MAADETFEGDDRAEEMPRDGRLRSPVLADGQPALTWWLPLPGALLALVWAAYQTASASAPGSEVLLRTLLWPGAAIFLATTAATYLGWRLDLD